MVNLVGAPTLQGYDLALRKTWQDFELDLTLKPVKSSLCEARQKVSYQFFSDGLTEQVRAIQPRLPKLRGLTVFATDGDQLELPAEEDILDHGYRGYPCKDGKETHYPRMYYTSKVEVFSGIVVDVRQSNMNRECEFAREMAAEAQPPTLTMYDRLHFSMDLARSHEKSGSFYLARCKEGETVLLELQEFIGSKRRAKRVAIGDLTIRFLKVKNPRTGEQMYLATNLPRSLFKPRELQWLYWRRYDIECVFRDLTSNHSLGVWHSKKMNGILQEFYLQFWIHNACRFLVLSSGAIDVPKELPQMRYQRPNFKLIREHFLSSIRILIQRQFDRFKREVAFLVQQSRETREWLSRSAPRQVKYTRNLYPSGSLVARRV